MGQVSICPGQRPHTPQLRKLEMISNTYSGLPDGTDRFEILRHLEIAGSEFGFKARHIRLLAYYIKFTAPVDWTEESYHPPIVWQSVSNTALEFYTSERQIRRWENELHDLGALTWRDSGNHKRYGVRTERGYIRFAYGADLSPLASMFADLKTRAEEILQERADWKEAKRELSAQKRRVRIKMCTAELSIDELDELAKITATSTLNEIWDQIETLTKLELAVDSYFDTSINADVCGKDVNMSAKAAINVSHKYTTAISNSSIEDTCNDVEKIVSDEISSQDTGNMFATAHTRNDSPKKKCLKFTPNSKSKQPIESKASSGVEHITTSMVISVASEEFKSRIPLYSRPLAPEDLVEAARLTCLDIGINRHVWNEAVQIMGSYAAAVAILLIDVKRSCPDNPVHNVGAYLRGMISSAKNGDLQLHCSIFGILEKEKFDC